jgi:hypothetical protein
MIIILIGCLEAATIAVYEIIAVQRKVVVSFGTTTIPTFIELEKRKRNA